MRLAVPHFRQTQPHTCVPACVRMILAYRGAEHEEAELATAFETIPALGTRPEKVISGLETLGHHALWFENATIERLFDLLADDWPVIAFVKAGDLPHGRTGLHAVVIIGIEDDQIIYLDPSLDQELTFDISSFKRIWSNLGRQGLVVWI